MRKERRERKVAVIAARVRDPPGGARGGGVWVSLGV